MWRKFERLFGKESSLQRKVIVLYLLTAVIPIILIAGLSSALYYQSIMKKTNQWIEENAKQQEIVVRERMDSFENVLYELVSNKECIDLAKKVAVEEDVELSIATEHLRSLLQNSVYTYDGIRGITFLAGNGRYTSYTKWYGSLNETMWSQEGVQKEVLDVMGKEQKLTFIATVNLSRSETKEDYVILMGFPVRNLRTKEQSGVLVMALDYDVLMFENGANELRNNGVSKVVVDDTDKIVATTEAQYVNSTIESYKEENYKNLSRVSERRYDIVDTKWTIVNLIDTKLYQKEIVNTLKLIFSIAFSITLFFFFALYYISQKYILNVKKIAQGIHNYSGIEEEDTSVELSPKDELYTIVLQFDKMKSRIRSLVEMLQKRNEEIKIAAMNQKHAEIKALEAQINPHFLYNTLDSINWRAIEHNEEEISDMLGALGSLLRYSVSNIDMVVLLRAEIRWLDKYIFLQRDRFHGSFDCVYEVSDEAMDFPIYKMLLQPIIENSILHAFEEVKQGGLIQLNAFVREDGKLEIHIKDNGCGIPEIALEKIRKDIEKNDALNGDSIGISNVIHRLRVYYKSQAEIQVYSIVNQGTEFVLTIPKQEKGSEED